MGVGAGFTLFILSKVLFAEVNSQIRLSVDFAVIYESYSGILKASIYQPSKEKKLQKFTNGSMTFRRDTSIFGLMAHIPFMESCQAKSRLPLHAYE